MEDGLIAGLLAIGLIFVIVIIICLVLVVIGRWKLYKKAGKNGWEAIVPFYSDWVYVEIAGLNWWWFFVLIASSILSISTSNGDGQTISINIGSILALFGTFVCNFNIAKKLHKDVGFAVLMTIFPVILLPMIGFSDKYQFDNNVEVSNNGPFPNNGATNSNTNDNISNEKKDVKYCPHCGAELEKDAKFCPKCGKEV